MALEVALEEFREGEEDGAKENFAVERGDVREVLCIVKSNNNP